MLAQMASDDRDSVRADGFGHAGDEFVAEYQGERLARNGMTGQLVYITSVAQRSEATDRRQNVDRWQKSGAT